MGVHSEISSASKKMFISALRGTVFERVKSLATDRGLKLVSLKPFAEGIWNTFADRKDGPSDSAASLIVVEDDSFTTFSARAGVLEAMSTFFHRREATLLEREVSRLRFTFGVDHGVAVALPAHLASLAQSHVDKLLLRSDFSVDKCHVDFRDLVFATEGAGSDDQT
jgi:hypothetical protein